MKFNNKYRSIFIDPNSPNVELDEKVNIILSPAYYWVKRLTLPVKYARDAKKLLPSIFEENLGDGNYSYSVYKEGDTFIAFAYDDKVILDAFEEKGINSSNIANVYFAQSEIIDIEGALKVNETQSVYLKDGVLVVIPCCWIEEDGFLDLDNHEPSKHTISLAQFGHIIDNKSLYKIAAVFVALIVLVLVELFITQQKVDQLNDKKDTLFTKAKLQSTMFQNKAALKKYSAIHEKQTLLREYTAAIFSVKLQADERLEQISLKNRKLTVEFSALSAVTISKMEARFKGRELKFQSKKKENSWYMEMSI